MEDMVNNYFEGKKVFVTGHTGFKGSWLCLILHHLGAEVYGYSLKPHTNPNLFEKAKINQLITSYLGDIRDFKLLDETIQKVSPEIVIHMAAQPLVRESYKNPIETYEVNVMGTVNILEAVKRTKSIKSFLNVTTDKCYENKEWDWGYRENDVLGGYDPYSNSKACSELVTSSFRDSFFRSHEFETDERKCISTARAGNVIGGGDWSEDRLIPDFIRSIQENKEIKIRSPYAIRPWQHVLDCLFGYLKLIERMSRLDKDYGESWNFGPEDSSAKTVEWIVKELCDLWGENSAYDVDRGNHVHEANYLKLDCSKARNELNWYPKWNVEEALKKTVAWNKNFYAGCDAFELCIEQIREFIEK